MTTCGLRILLLLAAAIQVASNSAADDPPVIDPFGRKAAVRDDAAPGFLELSDGTILPGHIHATRDTRLKIYDEDQQRQREVPWDKIRQIQCEVEKEWMEEEWRFRENANNEKVFTGKRYPARIHVHTITLADGTSIHGTLSSVVYLQRAGEATRKFELHKRAKGKVGDELESLVFVRTIRLGPEALEEGELRLRKQEAQQRKKADGVK